MFTDESTKDKISYHLCANWSLLIHPFHFFFAKKVHGVASLENFWGLRNFMFIIPTKFARLQDHRSPFILKVLGWETIKKEDGDVRLRF